MKKSALQVARAAYQPKLPKSLKGSVCIKEGAPTQSVADQDEIAALFPNTYGMPVLAFEPSSEVKSYPAINVGVILSGGQAPGGHNVIAGLFDGIKKMNAGSTKVSKVSKTSTSRLWSSLVETIPIPMLACWPNIISR